jgi:carboxymethylenebutenolidase
MPWNQFDTQAVGGMIAGATTMAGANGDTIHTYIARPDGPGPYPGVVLINHAPGWDEFYREFSRRFAEHGFIAIAPNIFDRAGGGTPDEQAAKMRADGGVADASVIGDAEAAMKWIKAQPMSNGKVGVIGSCSAGRHAALVASSVQGFDAVTVLWGANIIQTPDKLTPKQPVSVGDLAPNLTAPMLGLFGNDDMNPNPDMVNQYEGILKELGKTYQFHRYDGAGHGFFYYQGTSYRPQAAMDGWEKVEAWFKQYLA